MNAIPDMAGYSREQAGPRVEVSGPWVERSDEVLTPLALQLLASLHRRFNGRRLELLAAREHRQAELDAGALPEFVAAPPAIGPADTAALDWTVGPIPEDLRHRRIEVTGPVDRKSIITALNSNARSFVADFEDSCSPTWGNLVRGQVNLRDAVRRTICLPDPHNGRIYRLGERAATLIVRPRGWHLPEKHVRIGPETVSGALFDFALFVVNNYEALARAGTAPYFYLPKLESHLEARLWNDVFVATQDALGLPPGTIKATVLVETVPAAFEMDAILFELREHCVGLAFGRRDYIFSYIKKFRSYPDWILPDRAGLLPQRHFLKACEDLLVQTCQRRGADALGAQAVPDGTRLAQRELLPHRAGAGITPADLLQTPAGDLTDDGLRGCIRVAVQYVECWLRGNGCVPLYNLMEVAATAEVCRAQLWQCLRHGARTSDGRPMTPERFDRMLTDELDRIHREVGSGRLAGGVFPTAARLFAETVKQPVFDEFLTLPAYEHLT